MSGKRGKRRRGAADSGRTRPDPAAPAGPALPAVPPGWERMALGSLYAALALLLLTPFVVTPATVFPFVVGKALWSRALIEAAFALWTVLALANPAYRPPRSWLLAALGLGLAASALSAAFGVSFERSLWSNYERMLGLIDAAHWAALTLVLASVLRSPEAWRAGLGALTVSGASVACLVAARALGVEVPFYGALPEVERFRVGGPFGNPTFLAVYMMANAVLAAGLAATARRPAPRIFWAGCAGVQLCALLLAGSVGGFAGLAAAAGCAAFRWTLGGRARARAVAAGALVVLAIAGAVLGFRFFDPGRADTVALQTSELPGVGALRHAGRAHLRSPSVQSRLAAWEAGLAGFSSRPVLGFGPGNFVTVFGKFGKGYAATAEPHDRAHGKLVEVAAGGGSVGLLCWLALWGGAAAVLLCAPGALSRLAGAALAGHLVQLQFLFDTAAGTMVSTVLLAYAIWLEPRVLPVALRPRLFEWAAAGRFAARARKPLAVRGARCALGGAAFALAFAGLVVNAAILEAADRRHIDQGSSLSGAAIEGIEAFPPLAEKYRMALFVELEAVWTQVRAREPERAARLLAAAEAEAGEMLRSAPHDWQEAQLLARFFHAVALTDPEYAAQAARHLDRARELAPGREIFPTPLASPSGLAARTLPDGRVELVWRPAPGAGYHQIARSDAPGAWRPALYAYDAGRDSFAVPAGPRYRIKACRHPRVCSDWATWP